MSEEMDSGSTMGVHTVVHLPQILRELVVMTDRLSGFRAKVVAAADAFCGMKWLWLLAALLALVWSLITPPLQIGGRAGSRAQSLSASAWTDYA